MNNTILNVVVGLGIFMFGIVIGANIPDAKPSKPMVEIQYTYGKKQALIESGCSIIKCVSADYDGSCECKSWDNVKTVPLSEFITNK